MKSILRALSSIGLAASFLLAISDLTYAQTVTAVPTQSSGVYATGVPITWNVTVTGSSAATLNYVIVKNLRWSSANADIVLPAGATLAAPLTAAIVSGQATVTYTPLPTDTACSLMLVAAVHSPPLQIDKSSFSGKDGISGVVIAPDQIQAGSAVPSDFDTFWTHPATGKIPIYTNLTTYPLNPVASGISSVSGVSYQTFTLDNPLKQNGFGLDDATSRIYGQMAYPSTGKTYPGLLRFQHAGTTNIQNETSFGNNVTNMANKGYLALNINAFSVLVDGTNPDGVSVTEPVGDKWNKNENDFLRMFISCYRTAQYLKSMKYDAVTNPTGLWDGKTIVLYGASQGGLQCLFLAAFLPEVTAVIVDVPAGCNTNPTADQGPGWPLFSGYSSTYYAYPGVTAGQVGLYFDGANFARRITAPMLVGIGLIDNIANATNVYAGVSHTQGTTEILTAPSYGHLPAPNWVTRSNEWLADLAVPQTAGGNWSGPADGIWDTSHTNWTGFSGTPWDVANGPTNVAIFGTTSLAATVSGSVYTNGITFNASGALSGSTITLAGAKPEITTTANGTISSIIAGTAGLTKSGTGTLTLASANTYTGGTTINAGILQVMGTGGSGVNSSLGAYPAANSAGFITFNGGTLYSSSGTYKMGSSGNNREGITVNAAGGTLAGTNAFTLYGPVIGTGRLTISTSVTNTNAGDTHSGGTTVNSGATWSIYSQTFMGNNPASFKSDWLILDSGKLILTTSTTLGANQGITLGAGGGTCANYSAALTVNGVITGPGSLSQETYNTLTLNGANTHTGNTKASGGIIVLGNVLALQNSAYDTTGSNGTSIGVSLTGVTTPTLGGLYGSVNLASAFTGGYSAVTNLTLNPATGFAPSYSGIIGNGTSGMTLTKSGAGRQTLSGANTYSGATIVTAGTLALGASGSISTNVSIAAAAKLDTTAKGTYSLPAILALGIDGSGTSGQIDATGKSLVISGAAVTLNVTGHLGAPAYVLATYGSKTGAAFASVTPPAGYAIDYGYNGGTQIALVQLAGFASWIDGFGLLAGDQDSSSDADHDGIENLLEYVLNGNPATSDASILPALSTSESTFIFTYNRLDLSLADTIQTFQYGSDLSGWTSIVVPAGNGTAGVATITVTDNGVTDRVSISIPNSSGGSSGKLFGRLQVTRP